RILTQVVVVGTQIFGKAVVEAYRQVAANAAKNAAASGGSAGANAMNYKMGMTPEEAMQILNMKREFKADELIKNYEHLFKVNDPKNGGSHYLQSKVFRAKERLDAEIAANAPKQTIKAPG
ncbi:Pam16-domain-containing protein, partial [Chytridium lagenaria]